MVAIFCPVAGLYPCYIKLRLERRSVREKNPTFVLENSNRAVYMEKSEFN